MDAPKHIEKFIADIPEEVGVATCLYCHKTVETKVDDPHKMNMTVCKNCSRDMVFGSYPDLGRVE